ncbi:MAG: hypothetical protein HZB40_12675 [Rhodocyclales bacterium]|nr:hypothetical protein [Rhodocyclales bacterium]
MRRALLPLLLISAALLLPACSAVRLGYGNADSLARWWIDQYLDLSAEQDALARERLTRLMAWHRKSQLPDYASVLGQARSLATGKATAADGLLLTEAIIRRVRRFADQAIPDAADLLLTLTPAQIERMAVRQAEKNLSYAKEARLAEGEAGRRKARFMRLLERAEYWYGAFSDDQEAAIRQLVEAQPSGAQFWYEERLRRQNELLELARRVQAEKPSRERVVALLRDYADRFDIPADPSRRVVALALRQASSELAAAIQALTTPAQREHARTRFDDLIREIGELAQEA